MLEGHTSSHIPGKCLATLAGPFSLLGTYLITAFTPELTATDLEPGCLCHRRTQQGFVFACPQAIFLPLNHLGLSLPVPEEICM